MAIEPSILKSVKHMLNIPDEDSTFDLDIIMAVNAAFDTLQQLAVGPDNGFMITGEDESWSDFIGSDHIQSVKMYVYLRVRLLFDPPQTGFHMTAMKEQIQEMEWRLNAKSDPGFQPPVVTVLPLIEE